jgi:hypothetical protein
VADPADPPRLLSAENLDPTSLPFVIKDALKPFAILKKVGNDGFFILANHAFCTLYRYTLVPPPCSNSNNSNNSCTLASQRQ